MSNRIHNRRSRGLFAAFLLAAAVPVLAHHSFAVFFDQEKSVTITGVVEEFQFRNPHAIIRLAVKKGGATETWKGETNSPSILERRGWTRDIIKVGETITMDGWPSRDGANYMRVRSVKRANGAAVGSAPTSAAEAVSEQK